MTIARDLGMRPLVARCHLATGRVLRHASDLEPARERLTTAATMFSDMGMRFWLEQTKSELERFG